MRLVLRGEHAGKVLVMDAIRKTVSLVTGLYAETSAIPWLWKN